MIRCFGVVVCVLIFSSVAFAERYEVGLYKYEQGEYQNALEIFMELAKLGNTDAQYTIGAIYFRGEGVDRDLVEAYSWMKLSTQEGSEQYLKTLSIVEKKLSHEQLLKAELRIEELEKEHSYKILKEKLYPVFEPQKKASAKSRKPIKQVRAIYPDSALRKGMVGSATIEFMVGKDGRTRFHRVVNYTDKVFVKPSIRSAQKTLYKPAEMNGDPVNTYSVRRRFIYKINTGIDEDRLVDELKALREKAKNGSSVRKFQYAQSVYATKSFLSEEKESLFRDTSYWNFSAAKDGHPIAKYYLGTDVFYGEQCKTDKGKSLFWLNSAAEDGVVEAKMLLGLERYNGIFFDEDKDAGLRLLQEAAEEGNDLARIRYAELVLLNEPENQQYMKKAREFMDEVKHKKIFDKLSYYEVNAALYSAEGEFKSAKKLQKKALKIAKKLDLDVTLIESNLKRIESSEKVRQLVL